MSQFFSGMCPVPDIINGSASVDGSAISGPKFIQHERYIRYLCDTGFILKGNHTAFCKNGTFNSAIPSCVHDEGEYILNNAILCYWNTHLTSHAG